MVINKKLIKLCIAQDRMAQKNIYELLLPYLKAVANRYLNDASYIKDVLQESFIKIFTHIDKYDPKVAPLKTWTSKIVINYSINYNKRVIKLENDEYDADRHEVISMPQVLQDLSEEHLVLLLKQMPANYFEVYNLYVIDGYSHKEIAQMIDITAALSRKRLSRANSWLKKTFRDNNTNQLKYGLSKS